MSSDRTQHQSADDLRRAQEMSMTSGQPPAELPGYTLEEHIGSGAFGEVWKAIDQKTGRRVAIKFFTRRSKSDIRLMAAEVEKLAVLAADRYVVQLLDVGWDADPPYYVMDFVEYGSLEDRLIGGKTLSTSEAVELFQEIAVGMVHLHGKGVLHCDLKPGNILLDQDGKPRVADFGQSRLSSEQAPSLGTLFYMAPEQAALDAVPDARWDVYALGALLFSMLTGKPPYYCDEVARKIQDTADISDRLTQYKRAIQQAEKPTAHRKLPGVDRSLADLIDRCIHANPKKRISSVQEVVLSLRQREMSRARRPLLVLGLIGPLLLLSVMAFFGFRAYQRAIGDTESAITEKSVESNLYAARYAARSATERISEYMRIVRELSESEEFKTSFLKVTKDAEFAALSRGLADPDLNEQEVADRAKLIDNPLRKSELQPYLEERIKDPDIPPTASWFVDDRAGTQIASIYADQENAKVTLGKNYAYRSYFTGRNRDSVTTDANGKKSFDVAESLDEREIIDDLHISAIFFSDGSNTWKIAFSAPILVDGTVVGIVALTVDVGQFVDFPNVESRYAILVDARNGENKGTILEHPVFHEFQLTKRKIPSELARTTIDIDSVLNGKGFVDPIVQKTTAGADATGTSNSPSVGEAAATQVLVAAKAPVLFGRTQRDAEKSTSPTSTGLVVIAVEDYKSVVRPVQQLGGRLGQIGILASVFFVAVTIGMWILVMRMLRDSGVRLSRTLSPGDSSFTDSTSSQGNSGLERTP